LAVVERLRHGLLAEQATKAAKEVSVLQFFYVKRDVFTLCGGDIPFSFKKKIKIIVKNINVLDYFLNLWPN
jgi:hypothetical protein